MHDLMVWIDTLAWWQIGLCAVALSVSALTLIVAFDLVLKHPWGRQWPTSHS
jgi:hypothetical protein